MKFTVIIPSYNAENYIGKLLDSLVNQHYNSKDFEVIMVDDCSNDSTLKIAEKYKSKLRLYTYKLKVNSGGPGKPRNEAIKMAKGEYILFLDSDDTIAPETLKNVSDFIDKTHADTILVKMKGVNGRSVPQSMFKETKYTEDLANSRLVYTLSPTKFFKTSLLKENNIYFPENLKSAEDQIFTMKSYLKSDNIAILADQPYYFLNKREGEHMSDAYVHPKDFYKVMSLIVEEILNSNKNDKDKILGLFLNRHFTFSRTKNFSLKIKDNLISDWMEAFGKFVDLIPERVYKFVEPSILPLIKYGKTRNFEMYKIIEQSYKSYEFNDLEIKEGKFLAQFTKNSPYFDISNLDKPSIKMEDFSIDSDAITIDIKLWNSLVQISDSAPLISLKLYSRNKKESIHIPLKLYKNDIFRFVFSINDISPFITKEKAWDLFFEIKTNGYSIERRIGKNRNKYKYENETSLLFENNDSNYRLTPYFTKGFDNLSFYVKEINNKFFKLRYINSKTILLVPNEQPFILKEGISLAFINHKLISCLVSIKEPSEHNSQVYKVEFTEKIKKKWLKKGFELINN